MQLIKTISTGLFVLGLLIRLGVSLTIALIVFNLVMGILLFMMKSHSKNTSFIGKRQKHIKIMIKQDKSTKPYLTIRYFYFQNKWHLQSFYRIDQLAHKYDLKILQSLIEYQFQILERNDMTFISLSRIFPKHANLQEEIKLFQTKNHEFISILQSQIPNFRINDGYDYLGHL